MGQEKVDAAAQSAAAMGRQAMTLGAGFGLRAWRDLCAATQATIALTASRSADETAERQAELAQTLMRSAQSMSGLGNVGARIVGRGLRPIHAAATANARRLAVG